MQVFNASVKDLRMFLFSSRLAYMTLEYLQKLLLTAAAHV